MLEEKLPEGWIECVMGDIAKVTGGGTPKVKDTSNFSENGIPWLTPADLGGYEDKYINRGRRDLSEKGLSSSSAKLMPPGTVLMSSRAPIGYLAIAENEISTNQGFKSFVCNDDVDPEYVYYWLTYLRPVLESFGSGSTFNEISGSRAKQIPFRYPPLPEQKRIVAKLDEIMAEIKAAKEHLERAKELIRKFRQSVLNAAVTGKLTEGWRRSNNVSSDLVRTLRITLEIECAALVKEGQRKRIIDPQHGIDLDVPEEWSSIPLDILVTNGPQNGLYLPKSRYGTGTPIIRIDDYQNDRSVDRDNLKKLRLSEEEEKKYCLHPGDLLVNRVNSPSHIGKCMLVPENLSGVVFESNMMRIELNPIVSREWVLLYLQSDIGRGVLSANAKWAVNQVSINQTDVRSTTVPLPCRQEQDAAVGAVKCLLKRSEFIETILSHSASWSKRFSEGMLMRAFRGELSI